MTTNALIVACQNGHTKLGKLYIQQGADIDQIDKWGWTPLMLSVIRKHPKTASMLVGSGYDLDIVNTTGETALMLCVKHRQTNSLRQCLPRVQISMSSAFGARVHSQAVKQGQA